MFLGFLVLEIIEVIVITEVIVRLILGRKKGRFFKYLQYEMPLMEELELIEVFYSLSNFR